MYGDSEKLLHRETERSISRETTEKTDSTLDLIGCELFIWLHFGFTQILAPPGLACTTATHILLAPWSFGVGLRNKQLLVAPTARSAFRACWTISLLKALDSATSTTRQMGDLGTVQSERKVLVATSCAPNASKVDRAAQSGLRVCFRGCHRRGGTHLAVTLQTSLQAEEKLLEPPKLKGVEPKPGTPLLTHVV